MAASLSSCRADFLAALIVRGMQKAMVKRETNLKRRTAGIFIVINFLLSWTLLPLVIPPFRIYSLRELIEVILWQGMGAVGWPLALVGGFANLLLQGKLTDLVSLLFLVIYPIMLLLLILVLSSRRRKRWTLIMLHMLITFSFAAVWHPVLNGYDFMKE
jgi:hypothetical protein